MSSFPDSLSGERTIIALYRPLVRGTLARHALFVFAFGLATPRAFIRRLRWWEWHVPVVPCLICRRNVTAGIRAGGESMRMATTLSVLAGCKARSRCKVRRGGSNGRHIAAPRSRKTLTARNVPWSVMSHPVSRVGGRVLYIESLRLSVCLRP